MDVLLALPILLQSGVLAAARDVYGSIGPAFYGLRSCFLTLLFMALLRIKRPEGLKEHVPTELGRLVGLDRAPEVKTLRRKLEHLAKGVAGVCAVGVGVDQFADSQAVRGFFRGDAIMVGHLAPFGVGLAG